MNDPAAGHDRTPDEIMQAKTPAVCRAGWQVVAVVGGFVVLAVFLVGLAAEPFLGVSR